MRFEVKLGNEVVGFSELEGGDAPMGVALGRLTPTPAYASIQPYCIEHRDHWVNISGLTVETPSGVPIECSGGIQIIDFSPELGDAGIEIHNCPAFYLKKGLRLESRSRILGPALTGVIC